MKKMAQISKLVALMLSVMMIFASCKKADKKEEPSVSESNSQSETSEIVGDTKKITDSCGREVEIPSVIDKVAPSGSVAEATLYTVAKDKLVGWSSKPDALKAKYLDKSVIDLPEFGTFYGKKANLNLEALMNANPQLIIDVGEAKDGIKDDMDNIQEQTGVPTIFLSGELSDMASTYRTLGEIFHKETECEAMAKYIEDSIKEAETKKANLKEEDLKTVYFANGNDGLSTHPAGSFHTDVIDFVGIKNVVGDAETRNNVDVSLEQVVSWDPEVIIASADGCYEPIKTSGEWKDVKAVKDGKVYEVPAGPYSWIGRPPAANRIIGIKWAGNILYPEVYDYDMVKEAKDFYKMFYDIELTDDEAKEFMAHSQFLENK